MDPNFLQTKAMRKFNSEAEYRLWQVQLAEDVRQSEPGEGLVSRIVSGVRNWSAQPTESERKQRVSSRPAKQRA